MFKLFVLLFIIKLYTCSNVFKHLEDELNEKYKDYGKQQLKLELREFEKKQNKDVASILFISKMLRNKIDNKKNKRNDKRFNNRGYSLFLLKVH